jgi:hypothetical protein
MMGLALLCSSFALLVYTECSLNRKCARDPRAADLQCRRYGSSHFIETIDNLLQEAYRMCSLDLT